MSSTQHTPPPTLTAPFAAMLRGSLWPTAVLGALVTAGFWLGSGSRAGLAALLAVSVTIAFFAAGLWVMTKVVNANPISVLAGALAVYLGQVLFLGVVIISLVNADWLDGRIFGIAALVIAVAWQVLQIVAFVRMRKSVFDARPVADAPQDAPPVGD